MALHDIGTSINHMSDNKGRAVLFPVIICNYLLCIGSTPWIFEREKFLKGHKVLPFSEQFHICIHVYHWRIQKFGKKGESAVFEGVKIFSHFESQILNITPIPA